MTRTIDPFDELASMFLTEAEGPALEEPAAASVEVLVVGHLPVRAGLWLTPYADAVARELGPVALLRFDGDAPAVHVLRSDDDPLAGEPGLTLRPTIEHLAATVRTWIIRPASDNHAPALLMDQNIDCA